MANWQRTLDIYDAFQACDETPQGIRDLSKIIADKLKELVPFGDESVDEGKTELILAFEDMTHWEDADVTLGSFNSLMDELYDWGDTLLSGNILNGSKVCWIAATAPTVKARVVTAHHAAFAAPYGKKDA